MNPKSALNYNYPDGPFIKQLTKDDHKEKDLKYLFTEPRVLRGLTIILGS